MRSVLNEEIVTPTDPNQTNVEAQHRTLLIIWTMLLMSVIGFLVFTVFVPSNATGDKMVIAIILIVLGCSNVSLSFTFKRALLKKSIENRDLQFVSRAYIAALALCESAALFGVIIHFVTGSASSYVAFAVGLIGMLLHFPQKKHLQDVFFKPL
jgi:putative Mn2+ efflux pump MntP